MGIAPQYFRQATGGGEARRLTAEKDRDIQDYFWKGNDFIIFAMDDRGDENFHLKRVNVKNGEVKVAAENPGNIERYITDHAGKIRAATTTDGVNTSLLTRSDEGARFKTVLTTNFREQCSPQFYTFDDKAIYADSNIGRDKSAIVVIDPWSGKETKLIYENPKVDVDGLAYSKKRKVLTFATSQTWKMERNFFDPKTESMYKSLTEKLPGYEVDASQHDKAEEKFIVTAFNESHPGSALLVRKAIGQADQARRSSSVVKGIGAGADEAD